ncbi:anti-sigma factor [soil metagenome]
MKRRNPGEVPPPEDVNRAKQAADLLPAYTLEVLEDDEHLLVEEELASSQPLRDEHSRYRATIDVLAAPTPLTAPPHALRGRVLAFADVQPEPVPIVDRRSRMMRVALGLAAALLLLLAGVVAGLWTELNERDSQIASLQPASSRPPVDFSQPLVWTALSVAGSTGSGYFCRTEDGSVGWIVVEGMPVTAGNVYQLWLVDGERLESAGIFVTDAEGRGFGVVRASAPVTGFEQLWITAEPPGGSPAPTSDPHVSVTIV